MIDLSTAPRIPGAVLSSAPSLPVRALLVVRDGRIRQQLREILLAERNVEVAGETETAGEAERGLAATRPDLVILDSGLPQSERTRLFARFDPLHGPAVALLGTDPRRALDAIRMRAVDFLLLPLDPGQLRETVRRSREALAHRQWARRDERAAPPARGAAETDDVYPSRIAVRSTKRLRFVHVDEIDWVEADGNHIRLHRGVEIDVLRESISACERLLDPRLFARIHRSAIVRIGRIEELEIDDHGDCTVVLRDQTRLPVARGHRASLEKALQHQ